MISVGLMVVFREACRPSLPMQYKILLFSFFLMKQEVKSAQTIIIRISGKKTRDFRKREPGTVHAYVRNNHRQTP